MNAVRGAWLVAACGLACGPTPRVPVTSSNAPPPTAAPTRYRVGDRVEYTMSGEFSPSPVKLVETVVAKQDDRLRIDVEISRGADTRRFAQVLTDTPENEENNVLDALYELKPDGGAVALDPHADLMRVYEWTLIKPDGKASDVKSGRCDKAFTGSTYECACTTGRNVWHGRPVRFENAVCPDFLWTHGPARFWDEATGGDILRAEVTSASHVDVAPQPFDPRR
jgi:hypothetical protein